MRRRNARKTLNFLKAQERGRKLSAQQTRNLTLSVRGAERLSQSEFRTLATKSTRTQMIERVGKIQEYDHAQFGHETGWRRRAWGEALSRRTGRQNGWHYG